MSPEKPAQAASHEEKDAANDGTIDKEKKLGANATDAATKKKNETKPAQTQQSPKYNRRSI